MSEPWSHEVAFTQLYLSYYSRIYAAAYSLLRQHEAAEDTTQQVFMRLWEQRDSIRPENVEGYLITMAKNAILNQFRHKSVQARYRKYLTERLELGAGNVEELFIQQQQQATLQQVVNALPSRQQEAWRLSREKGFTYREIARQMRISKDSAKQLLQKAVRALKEALLKVIIWIVLIFYFMLPPPQRYRDRVNIMDAISRCHE